MTDRRLPSVPDVQGIDTAVSKVLRPLREIVLRITGRLGSPIERLEGTASTTDLQNKLNEVIDRLNQ